MPAKRSREEQTHKRARGRTADREDITLEGFSETQHLRMVATQLKIARKESQAVRVPVGTEVSTGSPWPR